MRGRQSNHMTLPKIGLTLPDIATGNQIAACLHSARLKWVKA